MSEIKKLKDRLAQQKGFAGSLPPIELLIRRPDKNGQKGEFVAKIRLVQLKDGKSLATADVLSDWQQLPIHEGDVIWY
jgi:hypothetical protein